MTAMASAGPRFDMGRVISRTFGAIGRNWLVFALLALLLSGLPTFVIGVVERMMLQNPSGLNSASLTGLSFGASSGAIVSMICMFVLQAAIVHGVVRDLNGERADFGDCISTGMRFFLPVLAITILMGIALVFGFILLIVPGVLMALAWSVVVPAEVVERAGVFGAFTRSAELTRNFRGAILGLWILYLVVAWIISMSVFALSGGFQSLMTANVMSWPTLVVNSLLQPAEMLISSAGAAVVYYELRSAKEGIGPEALASVFD